MQVRRLSLLIIILALVHETATMLTHQKSLSEDIDSAQMVLKVNTHLVMVDAVVRDRSGAVISDLKDSDFKVYENGKLQKVAVFGFHQVSNASSNSNSELPSNTFTNLLRLEEAAGPPTVLLIDT